MGGDLADLRATLPPTFAHDVMRALRQTFAAGVRYGYMETNPAVAAGDNPAPKPRPVRAYTLAELDALEAELGRSAGRSCRLPPRREPVRSRRRCSNGATSTGPGGC
jgi:hypothetical protein